MGHDGFRSKIEVDFRPKSGVDFDPKSLEIEWIQEGVSGGQRKPSCPVYFPPDTTVFDGTFPEAILVPFQSDFVTGRFGRLTFP